MLESYNYIQFKHKYTVVSLFDWCEHLTCDACMHFTIYTDTWWAVKLVAFQWEWISAFQYIARIASSQQYHSLVWSMDYWPMEFSIHKVKAALIHCENDHLFTGHLCSWFFIVFIFHYDSNSTKHFQRYHKQFRQNGYRSIIINIIFTVKLLTLLNWQSFNLQFESVFENDININVDWLLIYWIENGIKSTWNFT